MAEIHRTTMTPGKLELLAEWLPTRPWFRGGPSGPALAKAGGFRLDDPAGDVGIEVMVVTDTWAERSISYLVPMTYRDAPLDGAATFLIGTSEHGVLGRRFVYDAAGDPVFIEQVLALLQGDAMGQHQNESNTPDPTVAIVWDPSGLVPVESSSATDGPDVTDIAISSTSSEGLTVRLVRRLGEEAVSGGATTTTTTVGHVAAGWQLPDGTTAHEIFFSVTTPSAS